MTDDQLLAICRRSLKRRMRTMTGHVEKFGAAEIVDFENFLDAMVKKYHPTPDRDPRRLGAGK